jgi:hypothetical protein
MRLDYMFRIVLGGLILVMQSVLGQQAARYQYVFPKPNSEQVSRETNIIVRPGKKVDRSSLINASLFTVSGTRSGLHEGQVVLSDDEKTIVFNPFNPFVENEHVTVIIAVGLRASDGSNIEGTSFEFKTSLGIVVPNPIETTDGSSGVSVGDFSAQRGTMTTAVDTLPVDFPPAKVDTLNNPAQGEIFLGGFSGVGGTTAYANYLLILDNAGKPLGYKRIGTGVNPFEYMFKVEPNGLYSYIERTPTTTTVKIVDSTFKVVDTYPKGNPATTSHADFLLLPNGHALVLYFDIKTIDMSKIVPGGNPAATVWGNLVQEFDLNKNVVFQWSSFDYLPITDTYENTLAASFDYSHANGVELDNDGNFMLSNRHMSEITKIDRNTGEIIWRMGGKRNQFRFINEHPENAPTYFSYMHNIKRLPNGNITLFDNGNQRTPQYSRVVEYKLDEVNKTATLVWEYRHTPDIFAAAHGSAQRLQNGNTLVGWGDAGLQGKPSITEVHPDNSLAFELTLPTGYRSMRAYRLPWKAGTLAGARTRYELLQGNTYSFNDTSRHGQTGVQLRFNTLSSIFYNTVSVERFVVAPLKPRFAGRSPWMASHRATITQFGITSMDADIFFDVTQFPGLPDPNLVTIYQRDTIGSGLFSALQTSYNSVKSEIVANTSKFGEFIFCWNDSDTTANSPILLSPAEEDSVNQLTPVVFTWNSRGYTTGYHLQVASDSLFRLLVINDSLLTLTSDTLTIVAPKARYYWRIRTRNNAQTSNWSQARSFTTTVPYISVSSPNGNEAWRPGFQYFITWRSNFKERVRIELFQGASWLSTIKDSVSNLGAYTWSIPSTITPDNSYKIKITSISDGTLFGMSLASFSITASLTWTESANEVPKDFGLSQNYPNPFNTQTTINFQVPTRSHVSLRVYDLLGREVSILVDAHQEPGYKSVRFDASYLVSGIYFYRLKAGDVPTGNRSDLQAEGSVQTFVLTRKLLLMK